MKSFGADKKRWVFPYTTKGSCETTQASYEQKQCLFNAIELDQHSERREKVWRRGIICIIVIIMSCCLSCCASLTCGLCTSTASCISQKSARIGYVVSSVSLSSFRGSSEKLEHPSWRNSHVFCILSLKFSISQFISHWGICFHHEWSRINWITIASHSCPSLSEIECIHPWCWIWLLGQPHLPHV